MYGNPVSRRASQQQVQACNEGLAISDTRRLLSYIIRIIGNNKFHRVIAMGKWTRNLPI